jgi:hypothetical protein
LASYSVVPVGHDLPAGSVSDSAVETVKIVVVVPPFAHVILTVWGPVPSRAEALIVPLPPVLAKSVHFEKPGADLQASAGRFPP